MDKLIALVVEDDVDVARIFGQALQQAGFEAKMVHTGHQALTTLSCTTPTLVVLDVALPDISGIKILENIRSDPRFSKTHVILATAYAHLIQTAKDQSDLVLLKPVSYTQLRDLSRRLVTTAA
jgi:DNA-binding response OmpR family regulator